MKRKKGGSAATNLRSFSERTAAKKKQSEPENVRPCTNESQMQLVVFEGHSGSGTSTEPPEQVRGEQGQPTESQNVEDDESMPVDETESSDGDNDDYGIEHDPGLRAPISSYPVNEKDSVRRAYIAMRPCQTKMKRVDFPQHDCGGMRRMGTSSRIFKA